MWDIPQNDWLDSGQEARWEDSSRLKETEELAAALGKLDKCLGWAQVAAVNWGKTSGQISSRGTTSEC